MTPDKTKEGETGAAIGTSIWKDPTFRKLMGLPAGEPFGTYRPPGVADMGYYNAGDASGFSGLPSYAQNPPTSQAGGGNLTIVTPGRQRQIDRGQGYSRSHRMNVGNVRALRRSMRRVLGFAHLAKKVMTFTAHHKMKHHKRRK